MTNSKIVTSRPSRGANRLRKALGWPRIRVGRSYNLNNTYHLVNWGSSSLPEEMEERCLVMNAPQFVKKVSNKLTFFRLMEAEGLSHIIPAWTDDAMLASIWLTEGHTVVIRRKLTGHSGEGIDIRGPEDDDTLFEDWNLCPLFTKYMPKKHEYRIHVFDGQVIDFAQKKRRKNVPNEAVNWMVRTHSGGFIYARKDVEVPPSVFEVALTAMHPTGLDFGAVDVIWNESHQRATVLEINTAPGLEGTTVEKYAQALKNFVAN